MELSSPSSVLSSVSSSFGSIKADKASLLSSVNLLTVERLWLKMVMCNLDVSVATKSAPAEATLSPSLAALASASTSNSVRAGCAVL